MRKQKELRLLELSHNNFLFQWRNTHVINDIICTCWLVHSPTVILFFIYLFLLIFFVSRIINMGNNRKRLLNVIYVLFVVAVVHIPAFIFLLLLHHYLSLLLGEMCVNIIPDAVFLYTNSKMCAHFFFVNTFKFQT